jgi:uridine monophosphate synthetase
MTMLTETTQAFALALLDMGAIQFGSFRLKLHDKDPSAPLSPIYIDLRLLRSFPDIMDLAILVYKESIAKLTYDCMADVPTAATPMVAILTHEMRIPMISPRLTEKVHGVGQRIDGVYKKGQIALLVDDLITKADSKLNAISILEEDGIRVNDVVVLVDREQGGAEELSKQGYQCHAALKLNELLRLYLNMEKIAVDVFERTVAYLQTTDRH